MNILVTSYKGGTGKTSIALNLATYLGYRYVTNDIIATPHTEIFQIDANKKKIPVNLCFEDKAVYDFGAMSTQIDPKIKHAESLCDMIIIPCGTDPRSLKAAVDTFTLMSVTGKPIVIIINNYTKEKKFEEARSYLQDNLGNVPIFAIRFTTLFDRVAKDGRTWLENIHNDNGEYQLRKTWDKHCEIFDEIIKIGELQCDYRH